MPAPGFRYPTCRRGHPWTAANTYRRPDDGRRECRACRNRRSYEYEFSFRCCAACPTPRSCCKAGACGRPEGEAPPA